jgi:hypothetical protein
MVISPSMTGITVYINLGVYYVSEEALRASIVVLLQMQEMKI